jgi:hypothetical protein
MTSRIARTAFAGIALAGLATAFTGVGSAAQASTPATAVVAGTGTILPGLPLTGCEPRPEHVTFDGTAVVAGAPGDAGAYSLHFDGNSNICESLSDGKGSGTLSGGITGSVNYTRTGNAVTITANGAVTVNGNSHVLVAAGCVFVPVPGNPITTYALACTATVS